METFWAINGTGWAAITGLATIALTAVTFALVVVAYVQISAARDEARINRTLAACEKYDLDPTLDRICRRLSAARDSGDLDTNPTNYRIDLYGILNYLESIAIGVRRGLYSGSVVRDYMEPICRGSVEEYIASGLVGRAAPVLPVAGTDTEDDFSNLLALVDSWSIIPWYRRQL